MSYGKEIFDYARGYYMIFPRGMEGRDVGEGTLVVEEDYLIYFRPGTPDYIKQRFITEYAEYYSQKKEEQMRGIFIDT